MFSRVAIPKKNPRLFLIEKLYENSESMRGFFVFSLFFPISTFPIFIGERGNVWKKGEQFEVCVIMARVTTSTRVGYQDNVRHRNWL